ncbi:MAG: T9SS type A sorting domain-containing protein, partial [Bacteroidota bacterium]
VSIVAELAPQPPYLVFRSTEYPDTIPVQNLYAANYEIKRNNHNHYCSRYLGVVTGLDNGYKISAEKNWAIMRDYSNSGYSNIQFMQFVPEDRYFNLAVYRNGTPAYLTDSVRYYLDDLFTIAGNQYYGNNSGVKIYPNPFSNSTTIIIPAKNEERFNATMYSVQGTIVMTEENIPGGMFRFSCRSIPTGVYILSLKGDKGSTFNKLKLVIY